MAAFGPIADIRSSVTLPLLGAAHMAHFHVPKPLHGWRAFAGEVGIIVLGVLIALGAQEVAQYVSARQDATELRQSMLDELAKDRGRVEANHHDALCALKRLDEIRAWAAHPGSVALNNFDPPDFWTMHDGAWQIARSSPTMTALPLKDRDALATLYFVIDAQEKHIERAEDGLARVDDLAKTADRPASRDALPEAAAAAQELLRFMENDIPYLEKQFAGLGVRSEALGPDAFSYKNGCPTITPASAKA